MLLITTSFSDELLVASTSMTLKDPELQKEVLFFAIFGCAARSGSEYRRNGWK